jgi:hypothetical protein
VAGVAIFARNFQQDVAMDKSPTEEEGRLDGEAPEIPSGNNAPVFTSVRRIRGQRFFGVEVQVALDGEAKRPAQFANLAHADEAEFGAAHAEICEAEGDVIEPEFREQLQNPLLSYDVGSGVLRESHPAPRSTFAQPAGTASLVLKKDHYYQSLTRDRKRAEYALGKLRSISFNPFANFASMGILPAGP